MLLKLHLRLKGITAFVATELRGTVTSLSCVNFKGMRVGKLQRTNLAGQGRLLLLIVRLDMLVVAAKLISKHGLRLACLLPTRFGA